MQFGIGFLLAAAISSAAFAVRSLSRGGAIAAVALGTTVYGFGGWRAAVVLLAFFVSSSLLDRFLRPLGRRPQGVYAKGGRRDAGQVLSNGITAAAFAVLMHYNPDGVWPWLGFAGSIAAVNADTWATELGVLSSRPPRLITRLRRRVRPGTSGGVSLEGTFAALLGSTFISMIATVIAPSPAASLILPITAGGLLGTALDSYLGATVQGLYRCTAENVETEQHPIHHCGAPTVHSRGWSWLNNDLVNLACAASGAALACAVVLTTGPLL
ncbi:MAG: DUF92 domain-containing protein [Chloroflexota bacterium]